MNEAIPRDAARKVNEAMLTALGIDDSNINEQAPLILEFLAFIVAPHFLNFRDRRKAAEMWMEGVLKETDDFEQFLNKVRNRQ